MTRRADNQGMHSTVKKTAYVYGRCPICKARNKRLRFVSKSDSACMACIEKHGFELYTPPLAKEGNQPPKVWTRRKRTSHNI